MAWVWWLVSALLIGIAAVVLWLPVHVELTFRRMESDDEGEVGIIALMGLLRFSKRLRHGDLSMTNHGPAIRLVHSGPNDRQHAEWTMAEVIKMWPELQDWLRTVARLRPIFGDLLRRCELQRFRCFMKLGLGDVIGTGMLCGSAWASIYTLLGSMSCRCRFSAVPEVKIEGDFQKKACHVSLDCMLSVRTGHAMVAVLRFIREWRRRGPHGTPDSGLDANRNDQHS
ncbi:MAG: DUF2953 domain-containing protein [Alicyclobacillus sp.]|nr:DUF2953 domain-containing protein [Alicyclobacillus sp.]